MLYDYLEDSAARAPNRPALHDPDSSLSYAQLHRQALTFAQLLQRQDTPVGARVALWLPKSIPLYVAVHGTLTAGSCYLPIDISSPAERVVWISQDARARVLVCRAADLDELIPILPSCVATIVVVDAEPALAATHVGSTRLIAWPPMADEAPFSRPPPIIPPPRNPEALAYILYTSGSTGRPKGVALSHRAAMAFVEWAAQRCQLRENDRISNHASLSFDLSIFDVFAAAKVAACVYPVPSGGLANGYVFARFISEHRISVWYSVPSVLDRISDQQSRKPFDLSCLRAVVFAGEPFDKQQLRRFAGFIPGVQLENWYGPTETNVCIAHTVSTEDLADPGPLPIGGPCSYAVARVDNCQELYIAGASLLSGYMRDGEIDSSPLVELPGEGHRSYYATGDLVSVDDRGNFQFHGRRDAQIKRNGYRIEPGEIETVVQQHEFVREAAVVVQAGRLYLFTAPELPGDVDILTEYLAEQLPPYMMPDRIIDLAQLPHNDRGKRDTIKLRMLAEVRDAQL